MPVADKMKKMMDAGTTIRKMFEEGIRMKEELGTDRVYDFSLGNPDVSPPEAVKKTIIDLINNENTSHAYMPNPGYLGVRQAVAEYLNREFNACLTPDLITMTVGAAGALNNILRTLLNPGEELLVPAPYFIGYAQYASIVDAKLKAVPSLPDFHLDLDAIKAHITEKTRVVLINSPNNPTGCVYTSKELSELGKILDAASQKFSRRIYLISDEPYRKIAFDTDVPFVFDLYPHSIVLTSYSKELSLAGERIGYLAIHPGAEDADLIAMAVNISNAMLYVNAPALFQQVVAQLQGETVDIGIYRKRRDLICNMLKTLGYSFEIPAGAFYLFPKSPIGDDVEFCQILKQHHILAVPGTSFGGPGYFRLSFAVPEDTITGSIDGFRNALDSVS